MRWNLRMRAAQQGIWKSTEMRRLLADAGLTISHGKMSALWTGTPTTVRLDDLEIICVVLQCEPSDLLICEPERVAQNRTEQAEPKPTAAAGQLTPRLGRNRTLPPA